MLMGIGIPYRLVQPRLTLTLTNFLTVENTIGRQLSVRRHNQKLLTDKPPTRSLTFKIIKHRLSGFGQCAP